MKRIIRNDADADAAAAEVVEFFLDITGARNYPKRIQAQALRRLSRVAMERAVRLRDAAEIILPRR